MPSVFLEDARRKSEQAARARRFALYLGQGGDAQRLLLYAEELEAHVQVLEAQARSAEAETSVSTDPSADLSESRLAARRRGILLP
jgi:hypothetical protein